MILVKLRVSFISNLASANIWNLGQEQPSTALLWTSLRSEFCDRQTTSFNFADLCNEREWSPPRKIWQYFFSFYGFKSTMLTCLYQNVTYKAGRSNSTPSGVQTPLTSLSKILMKASPLPLTAPMMIITR